MASKHLLRILSLALALGWMGVLYYLSSQTTLPIDAVEEDTWRSMVLRKLSHVAAFALLALLLLRGLTTGRPRLASFTLALVLTLAYAVADEIHQGFTPGRHASAAEVLLDGAGAVAALGLWKGLGALMPLPLFRRRGS